MDLKPWIESGCPTQALDYLKLVIPEVTPPKFVTHGQEYYFTCQFREHASNKKYLHEFHNMENPQLNVVVDMIINLAKSLKNKEDFDTKKFKQILQKFEFYTPNTCDHSKVLKNIQGNIEYLGSQPSYTKELHDISQSITRLEKNLDDLFRKVHKFPSKAQVEELLKFPETIYGEISTQLAESKKREEAINQHIEEIKTELEKDILEGVKQTLKEVREDMSQTNKDLKKTQQILTQEIKQQVAQVTKRADEQQTEMLHKIKQIHAILAYLTAEQTGEDVPTQLDEEEAGKANPPAEGLLDL